MSETSLKTELVESPQQSVLDFLDNQIVEYNHAQRELNKREPIAVTVKNDNDEIIAGATGVTFGYWLQLNILWVSEALRRQDYGSQLLTQIETAAKARGCHYCLLDTLNFQAMPFYQKHGYKIEWTQENYPLTGCKYFMTKTLS